MRFVVLIFLAACSTSSTTDAGPEAGVDSGLDLCDLDAFLDGGGSGHTCPMVSTRLCFHNMTDCPKQGCQCVSTPMGRQWKCTTDDTCKDSGVDDASDASSTDASTEGD